MASNSSVVIPACVAARISPRPRSPLATTRLDVALQHGLERLLSGPVRMLCGQHLDSIERKGQLHVNGLLGPQRAVVIERGDARGYRNKVGAALGRDAAHERQNRGFGLAVVPGWEWIDDGRPGRRFGRRSRRLRRGRWRPARGGGRHGREHDEDGCLDACERHGKSSSCVRISARLGGPSRHAREIGRAFLGKRGEGLARLRRLELRREVGTFERHAGGQSRRVAHQRLGQRHRRGRTGGDRFGGGPGPARAVRQAGTPRSRCPSRRPSWHPPPRRARTSKRPAHGRSAPAGSGSMRPPARARGSQTAWSAAHRQTRRRDRSAAAWSSRRPPPGRSPPPRAAWSPEPARPAEDCCGPATPPPAALRGWPRRSRSGRCPR